MLNLSERNISPFSYWRKATPESIQKEIDQGADVNAKNSNGKTPLMDACMYNASPSVFKTLIENGADVNARDNHGNTALMEAVIFTNCYFYAKTFIENGADVHAINNSGETALHIACNKNNKTDCELIAMLILAEKTANRQKIKTQGTKS